MKLIKNYREYGALCSFSKTFKASATNSAFTLAEMMVVMLILSVIMAAMAPVMTTRNKTDYSSPWKYTTQNPSNAYFGAGSAQIALIGQANAVEGDDIAKLVINTSDRSHIALKSGNSILARLHVDNDSNLFFSNISNLPTGTNNTGIGVGPLHSLTSGSYNTAIGNNALYSNTNGEDNIAIGRNSLYTNTTGDSNTAIGNCSLEANTTGGSNTAIGNGSLKANTTGGSNTAIGSDALYKATTASSNTAIGYNSLSSATTASNNTAIGNDSLSSATTGGNNTAIGDSSQKAVTTGEYNVSVGSNSMARETTGKYNTALGCDSMRGSTTGDYNIALGYRANYSETESYTMTGSIGIGAGAKSTADYAVAIGYSAASSSSAVAIGPESSATAGNSIAIGKEATTSNSGMIAIGNGANASGLNSIAIGTSAKGAKNIAIGYSALSKNESGNDNTAVGHYAGNMLYGDNNTIIGSGAGNYAGALTEKNTFSNMVAVGSGARVTDDGVIAIGAGADAGVSNGGSAGRLRGTDSIAIGHGARAAGINTVSIGAGVQNFRNNVIQLGTAGQTVYIPGNLVVGKSTVLGYNNNNINSSGSNQALTFVRGSSHNNGGPMLLYYGRLSRDNRLEVVDEYDWYDHDGVYLKTQYSNIVSILGGSYKKPISSDRRLKYVGKENTSGLDKIRQLKVFNYTYKKDTTKTPHVGVIAQDLQKVFPNAVKKGADGFLTIRMEDMFYALVNAVKELDAKITALQKENQELKAEMKRMNERLNKLEAKVK